MGYKSDDGSQSHLLHVFAAIMIMMSVYFSSLLYILCFVVLCMRDWWFGTVFFCVGTK